MPRICCLVSKCKCHLSLIVECHSWWSTASLFDPPSVTDLATRRILHSGQLWLWYCFWSRLNMDSPNIWSCSCTRRSDISQPVFWNWDQLLFGCKSCRIWMSLLSSRRGCSLRWSSRPCWADIHKWNRHLPKSLSLQLRNLLAVAPIGLDYWYQGHQSQESECPNYRIHTHSHRSYSPRGNWFAWSCHYSKHSSPWLGLQQLLLDQYHHSFMILS